jgi:hypothetical protein
MIYKTISSHSLANFQDELNMHVKDGWVPYGNFVFGKDGLGFDCWAMILQKED